MGEKTFVDDIVKHSVSEQENIPWYTNSRALTPKLLVVKLRKYSIFLRGCGNFFIFV